MSNRYVAAALSTLLLIPSSVSAQKCKPTVSGKEKLTKLQMDMWSQDVATTGFLSQVVLEKANVNLNLAVGRIGEFNVVRLTLTKEEESEKIARAVLESQYRAEKGNEFMLGFKEGGTPLRFVASTPIPIVANVYPCRSDRAIDTRRSPTILAPGQAEATHENGM